MTTVLAASLPPVRGSLELGEFGQHVGQLVAALPAADVDDHVGVAPLRDLLQQHGLAGAEPAGHGAAAALGHREQHVDHPLPGEQRRARRRAAAGTAAGAAPARLSVSAHVHARDGRDHRVAGDRPGLAHLLDRSAHARAAPAPGSRCRRGPSPCPGWRPRRWPCPPPSSGRELELLAVGSGGTDRRARARRARRASGRSRPSKMPPSRCGPSRADSGSPREPGGMAGREAAGVLVRLDGGHVAADGDGLAGQQVLAELDDVVHRHLGEAGHLHQRPVHPGDPRRPLRSRRP